LLLLSTTYLVRGFKHLVLDDADLDLFSRWREQRYLYHGQNPNDLGEAAAAEFFHQPDEKIRSQKVFRTLIAKYSGRPMPECSRDRRIDPEIGPLYFWEGTYPGWSYFTAALFVLPTNWQFTRSYFAVLCALALAATSVWAYGFGRRHSEAGGVFLAASTLAMFGNYSALDRGQHGLIVNALLIGVYVLVKRTKPTAAGILYGLAAIKPQMSALFAFVFLVKRQWKLLATTSLYIVLASLCTWSLSKTNPLEMMMQSIDAGMGRGNDGGQASILSLLLELGVDRRMATRLAVASGVIAAAVIVWIWRNGTLPILFAIAATIGRFWTYHHGYDNVMMVFLLVALGGALLTRYSTWLAVAFGVVGVSLWLPYENIPRRYASITQLALTISWLIGFVTLLIWDSKHERRSLAS
jgi:hypothetical protein